MGENNDRILNELTCPICFNHPEKEVYQCRDGHPICSSCILQVNGCPSCHLPFGFPHTRCRLMESMLDIVILPCVNKDFGCEQQFFRKELLDHQKTCEFRSVSLCKWMGLPCDYQSSTVEPLVKHFETFHNAKKSSSVVWEKFPSFRQLYLQECAGDSKNPKKSWILFFVTLKVELTEPKFFTCVPILLQDGRSTEEHQVQLDVFYHRNQKKCLLSKWTGIPTNYKDAGVEIRNPSFRLTTNYIKEHALKLKSSNEFKLNLSFSVTETPLFSKSSQEDSNKLL